MKICSWALMSRVARRYSRLPSVYHLAFSRLSLSGSLAYPPRETTRLSMGSKASMVCIDPSECLMVNTYGDGGDRGGASFRPKYSQMVESLV